MNIRTFNWPIWTGFLLSLVAFLSYPLFFVNFPVTRDFPWANLLLFAVALALLLFGVKRAFAPERSRRSKIGSSILATLGVVIIGLFIFTAFVMSRWLPAAQGAPQVGQNAPDFTLTDAAGKATSLAELLSMPINSNAATKPKGVLLIFYRGHW